MDDGAAEGEPLLPAAGKGVDSAMKIGFQAGEGENFLDALGCTRTGNAVNAGVEAEVFLGDGEVFVEAEFLRHVADMALGWLGGIFADAVHTEDGSGALGGGG